MYTFFKQMKCFLFCVFVEVAQVTTAYTAAGAEQLNLAPPQLILILNKNPSGWWLGELQVSETCHFKGEGFFLHVSCILIGLTTHMLINISC